jgi:hypothetical protein
MTAGLSAVVVGADRLGNIPDLLKGHNISITHHISGRDPSHQKKTLQLPSGTQLVILLTDFLGHNVMKTFRNAAQRGGIRVVACRRSVCSRPCSNAACASGLALCTEDTVCRRQTKNWGGRNGLRPKAPRRDGKTPPDWKVRRRFACSGESLAAILGMCQLEARADAIRLLSRRRAPL